MSVSRETDVLIRAYAELVIAENSRQNLVAGSTVGEIWERHVLDSLQLSDFVTSGPLLDIGSGAGFPGVVLAIVRADPVLLAEPRRRRCEFLVETIEAIGIANAAVRCARVEAITDISPTTITARAVAPLDRIFGMAAHLASDYTRWVLPKGRSVEAELREARDHWTGEFDLIPSRTASDSFIVVATNVRRRRPA